MGEEDGDKMDEDDGKIPSLSLLTDKGASLWIF